MIYFVEAVGVDRIKIGHTKHDVKKRVKVLQTGCPHTLRLVGSCKGNVTHEAWLHDKFSAHRISGEWFVATAELRDFAEKAELPSFLEVRNELYPRFDEGDGLADDEEASSVVGRWRSAVWEMQKVNEDMVTPGMLAIAERAASDIRHIWDAIYCDARRFERRATACFGEMGAGDDRCDSESASCQQR